MKDKLVNYISNDESKILINSADYKKSQGRGRRGYIAGTNSRNGNKICTYCGKSGHTIETCYKKHGYPPNW